MFTDNICLVSLVPLWIITSTQKSSDPSEPTSFKMQTLISVINSSVTILKTETDIANSPPQYLSTPTDTSAYRIHQVNV